MTTASHTTQYCANCVLPGTSPEYQASVHAHAWRAYTLLRPKAYRTALMVPERSPDSFVIPDLIYHVSRQRLGGSLTGVAGDDRESRRRAACATSAMLPATHLSNCPQIDIVCFVLMAHVVCPSPRACMEIDVESDRLAATSKPLTIKQGLLRHGKCSRPELGGFP